MKQTACILLVLLATRCAFAMSSTDITEGPIEQRTAATYGFPDNSLALINDWHRFYAWHPWFSELPNAAYFFGFSAPTMSDVNELLGYFGEIKAVKLVIELNPEEKDSTLARHFEKPKDKPEAGPLTLCLCAQKDFDRWFDHLDADGKKKFHVTDRPEPGAATMTIFAGNKIIDLDKLKIPKNATVQADIRDWQRKDPKLAKAIERIEQFVSKHNPTTAPASGVK